MKIEVNNREITSALDALQNAIGNVDPALKEIGDYLIDSTKRVSALWEALRVRPPHAHKAQSV